MTLSGRGNAESHLCFRSAVARTGNVVTDAVM